MKSATLKCNRLHGWEISQHVDAKAGHNTTRELSISAIVTDVTRFYVPKNNRACVVLDYTELNENDYTEVDLIR